jgi:Phage DNA packaging protein, Nu1 subunit of terminase
MREELELVNRAELARLFDVSLTTVDSWRRRGLPVEERGGRGRALKFSLPAAIAWRLEQEAGEESSEAVISFEEARTAKMIAEAELARIELQKRRGEIVELDVVAEIVESDYGVVRSKVFGLATKVAAEFVNAGYASRVRGIIEREARELLRGARRRNRRRYARTQAPSEEGGQAPGFAAFRRQNPSNLRPTPFGFRSLRPPSGIYSSEPSPSSGPLGQSNKPPSLGRVSWDVVPGPRVF